MRKRNFTTKWQTSIKLHHTTRWHNLRDAYIARHPLCRMCYEDGIPFPADVVDHIIPGAVDESLFFVESNLQSLCHNCHDHIKTPQDRINYPWIFRTPPRKERPRINLDGTID